MTSTQRHKGLAVVRDLFAMPVSAFVALIIIGEMIWLAYGSTSASYAAGDGYCGDGISLLLFLGGAAWMGAVAGSVLVSRSRATSTRVLVAIWNAVITAPLILYVILFFVIGVAACNE